MHKQMGLCFLWMADDFSPMKGGVPETKGGVGKEPIRVMKESKFVESVSGNRTATFATNASRMIEVGAETYARTAQALYEEIGEAGYYNGSIEIEEPHFTATLTATLIVYRERERQADEPVAAISNMVPVWWEFRTIGPDGDEVLNDFEFQPLKEAVLALQ